MAVGMYLGDSSAFLYCCTQPFSRHSFSLRLPALLLIVPMGTARLALERLGLSLLLAAD